MTGYDVIVVGTRVAGSATAMLLARRGLKVLAIDRARFPSDTLSTHQMQVPGGARLARWGLLDKIIEAGTPPTRQVTFAAAGVQFSGRFRELDGVDALYSPRRTSLDTILVQAARDAGADVREGTIVEELLSSGGRVTGVRCHEKGGARWSASASLVIGADGKNSLVAKAVSAPATRSHSARTVAFYSYWEGVTLGGGRVHNVDRRSLGAWSTNDGLVITYLAWPASEQDVFRADPERAMRETLVGAGGLGQQILAGRRVEPIRATTDVPNAIRRPYGPGWALAGDAGLVMDPITGQGIGNALRDAELLSSAIVDGFSGRVAMAKAMANYAKARDKQTKPMYDLTVDLASFAAPSAYDRMLFGAIAETPGAADQFMGVLSGVVPLTKFFSPPNLIKLVGLRGFVRLARNRTRSPQPRVSIDGARA